MGTNVQWTIIPRERISCGQSFLGMIDLPEMNVQDILTQDKVARHLFPE